MFKTALRMLLVLTTAALFAACGSTEEENTASPNEAPNTEYAKDVEENPIATITMATGEKIVIELEPKTAPNTVANFIALANDGFYDGLIFHRVIDGFMIQGGDPEGTGMGGPDYSIFGEFTNNGFDNDLKHTRGVISMARTADPNSAGSQFFIMHEDAASLDNEYAAFGKVLEGIEVVDRIAKVELNREKPVKDEVMESVSVDTKGFEYPAPAKQ